MPQRGGAWPQRERLRKGRPRDSLAQMQHKQMTLAMSVGDRHYAVDSVRPRHFMQSARRAGVSAAVVRSVAAELIETVPEALELIGSELPRDCPEEIRSSIAGGVMRRLHLLKEGEP